MTQLDPDLIRPSDIEIRQVGKPIEKQAKFAFCFSSTSWVLLVSASGHEAILRGRDKQDFDCGGWADLKTGRVWAVNGTIKNVPKKWRPLVEAALSNHFRTHFVWH